MPKKTEPNPEAIRVAASVMLADPPTDKPGCKPLADEQHELFCIYVSQGYSDVEAYMRAYGQTRISASANAYLIRRRPGVLDRITFLSGDAFADVDYAKRAILNYHATVMGLPLKDVDEDSPYAQKVKKRRLATGKGESKAEWEIMEIELPSKSDSAKEISKILGLYAKQEMSVSVQAMTPAEQLIRLEQECLSDPMFETAVYALLERMRIRIAERRAHIQTPAFVLPTAAEIEHENDRRD